MMAFTVGMKVVCVVGKWVNAVDLIGHAEYGIIAPVKGGVYTVREIETSSMGTGLRFEEIRNAKRDWGEGVFSEPRFMSTRFRPVRTTETGMEMLRKLSLPKSKRARKKASA
jgi:hypothetical protein